MAKTPQYSTTTGNMDPSGLTSGGRQPPGSYTDDNSGEANKGLVSQASEAMMNTAEQQKAAGAAFVSGMAGAVRRAAGEFDGQLPQAASYIRYAADQLDTVSDSFRRRDIGQLVSDVQSMARRQPALFLGATFLAGFAAVRFLKSSSENSRQGYSRMDEDEMRNSRYGRPDASSVSGRSNSHYPM